MDEQMDLSDDLNQILFLIEDSVFVRWRLDYNFFNQSIYGRLFERGNLRFRDYQNMSLPEIKGEPNTTKLQKSGFYQRVNQASSTPSNSLATIRRRRHNSGSLVDMLHDRERNSWRSDSNRCYVNNMFLPNSVHGPLPIADKLKYCCVFSPDNGRHLLVASIDGHVTVYNTEKRSYKEVAKYCVDQATYSLLDLDVSPNGREFLCSTWKNYVFTCNVLEEDDINRNYVKGHKLVETINKMGTFSTCFNNDGTEILASSNEGCIYVFDRNRNERSLRILQDAREDINATRFLDPGSNNIIIGAANNGIIEIWDRRTLGNEKNQKSVATMVGHFDGITYIDPKGDGRYFLTNSKDQSVKLWDVRKVGRRNQVKKTRKLLVNPTWNYLSDSIPPEYYGEKKPLDGDCSVMTYRGHRVTQTLIRAKFSPLETTGNRFIYTGCSTGRVLIYDTLSGRIVRKIESHSDLVRDVSWHPSRPEIELRATIRMLPGVGVCGTDIRILVPILREYGFSVEALWGKLQEAEALAEDLKIPYFSNKMDDVLLRKNVDLVFIACPPHLHAQVSNKALGIGKHVVVCSQPLGLGQADALKMTRASQYYPSLIALTTHTLRFLPAVTQMRRLIQEQYVGEPVLLDFRLQMGTLINNKFDWLCDDTMGGGILTLFGSHLIDLVSFVLKQRAVRVNGTIRTYTQVTEAVSGIRRVTAPDFCTFQMEMEGGALVTMTLHSHQCISGPAATAFFSQEMKVAGSDGSYLMLRGNDLFGQRSGRTATPAKGRGEEVLYVDDSTLPSDQHLLPRPYAKGLGKMVAALREAFLPVQEQTGWIKSPVEMAATFEDGLYVQAVLDAIRKSSEERAWMPVLLEPLRN